MPEHSAIAVAVYSLAADADVQAAADAFQAGRLFILRLGGVFGIAYHAGLPGYEERINFLKGREKGQSLSLICTARRAKEDVVDWARVNPDFGRVDAAFCARAMCRVPVRAGTGAAFPYNRADGTVQFLSLEHENGMLAAFQRALEARGVPYIAGTSGNIHGAGTVNTLEDAVRLAAFFNIKARFFALEGIETVVLDVPGAAFSQTTSYPIVSFCRPGKVEVVRFPQSEDPQAARAFARHIRQAYGFASPVSCATEKKPATVPAAGASDARRQDGPQRDILSRFLGRKARAGGKTSRNSL